MVSDVHIYNMIFFNGWKYKQNFRELHLFGNNGKEMKAGKGSEESSAVSVVFYSLKEKLLTQICQNIL